MSSSFSVSCRCLCLSLCPLLCARRVAANILRDIGGCKACTDVTGFGVLGHLFEMVKASDVCVSLDLDALPLLPGASECVGAGIFSSLHSDNLRLKRAVVNHVDATTNAKYTLLYDPQTAGGLLAGVKPQLVQATLKALHHAGYTAAAVVGRVTATSLADAVERVTCLWN